MKTNIMNAAGSYLFLHFVENLRWQAIIKIFGGEKPVKTDAAKFLKCPCDLIHLTAQGVSEIVEDVFCKEASP